MMRIERLAVCLLFVLSAGRLGADDHHESGEIPCCDCHSMHYGEVAFDREPLEPGGPYEHLLLAPEDELCLGCHDGTDPKAPNVLRGGVANLSAGWFLWQAPGEDAGGHTLGTRKIPPGSAAMQLERPLLCISCHDPHGNRYYRNLTPEPAGVSGLGLTYESGESISQKASVHILNPLTPSRFSEENILYGTYLQTGEGAHISDWCGSCHGLVSGHGGDPAMGGSPSGHKNEDSRWLQHPVKGMPMSVSVGNGHSENAVWFDDHASRLTVASAGEIPGSVGDSDNEITCLTCHTAHGSGHPFSLIYDDADTFLKRDGARISQSCGQCHRFGRGDFEESPHGDPEYGVLRLGDFGERGDCLQCHVMHGTSDGEASEGGPYPYLLFSDYRNEFCFGGASTGGCHRDKPFGYPAQEIDRMPEYSDRPGYFEHNTGGVKLGGVMKRKRWPGDQAYMNPLTFQDGKFYSPHAQDQDMPLLDDNGQGACRNCHEPHSPGAWPDLLISEYGPISGSGEIRAPVRYSLCLDCHSLEGPVGMDIENQRIRDYYDSSINDDQRAGHQIRFNGRVALSWPANVEIGDKLPCYDCHNPHGSLGYDQTNPNGFLLSDERPGWSGLTDTIGSQEQSRRFCLGCHIPSDGTPGSKTVEGIVMNSISARWGHAESSTESCHLCHGSDYSTSVSYNVHHPAGGQVAIEKERKIR